MSKQARELKNLMTEMFGIGGNILPVIVESVDKINNTCEVKYDNLEFGGIRLQAAIKENQKGIKVYPAVNSSVLIQKLGNKGEWFVCMFSEVEEIITEIGELKQTTNKDGYVFKKGNDTLWDGIKLLIESLEKVIVLQGTNIDKGKLAQAKTKIKNVLNGS